RTPRRSWPEGWQARGHREPLRRAPAAHRGQVATMRVTVLTGGTSSERDVALASAVQIVAALRTGGHEGAGVATARGYTPEGEERSALAGSVGAEPPPIAELRAL